MSLFKNAVAYNKSFSDSNSNLFNHARHKIEHSHVLRELQPSRQDKILEIGCNFGEFVRKLSGCCENVVGIDINDYAVKKSGLGNVMCMGAEQLAFHDCSFDKVVSMHTIEHVPDARAAFSEMGRVLKKGGIAVLTYPFEPIRGVAALRTACIAYRNPLACRKLHVHKFNYSKVSEMISGTSLRITSHRLVFVPWPVYITVLEKA